MKSLGEWVKYSTFLGHTLSSIFGGEGVTWDYCIEKFEQKRSQSMCVWQILYLAVFNTSAGCDAEGVNVNTNKTKRGRLGMHNRRRSIDRSY